MNPDRNLGTLLDGTLHDTLAVSLPHFRPELCLAATIVLLLLCRMLPLLRHVDSGFLALGGVLFSLFFAWDDVLSLRGGAWVSAIGDLLAGRQELFGGLLAFDSLTAYIRLLLAGFLVLFILFTKVSGIPDSEDGADFYTLVLGSTLGMCLMASANHLLMVFMAVEMASVPSYALAGLLKGRKASSEAALKYAVYGAGAAASKAAAIALLLRVAFGMGTTGPGPDHAVEMAALGETRHFIVGVIALLAALTCTLGNLAAYGQTNMKRLLAYSTIAHAGYLMMGVAAAVALAGRDADASRSAVAAVCFYLGTYVFMNLAAFAIVALLRNSLRSEEIASYAGLIRTNPGIVVATGIVLVSLIGLPPLAGFISKFLVFSSIMEAVSLDAERPLMLVLLVVGGINTVISLFYYLRVLKVMTFDPPPADRTADAFPLVSIPGALVTALVVPVVSLGIFWSGLYAFARLAGAFAS